MYWFAEVHSAVLPFTYAVSMQALGFAPGRLFPFTTYSVDWSRLSETAVGYHAVGISPVSCAAKAPPAAESTPVVREITATEFVFAFVTYSVRSLEEMARLFGLAPRSFSGLEKTLSGAMVWISPRTRSDRVSIMATESALSSATNRRVCALFRISLFG